MEKFEKKNIDDILALTPMQEGILFHYLKEPGSNAYFEQLSLSIQGDIHLDSFEQAWNFVIQTNEMLRTVFRWEKMKSPIQIILKKHRVKLKYYDFYTGVGNGSELRKRLEELKVNDRKQEFDLRDVPFRVTLCRIGEDKYRMIISNHHILYDGWSNGVVLREFFNVYHDLLAKKIPSKPAKTAFKEFVQWNQRQNADTKKQAAFWREYMEGSERRDHLPIKKRKTSENQGKECEIRKHHSRLLWAEGERKFPLEDFVKVHKITTAALLYGAWGILLQKYANSSDVIFANTISGRSAKINGIEDIVGLFINTLPLRVRGNHYEVLEMLKELNNTLRTREPYETTPLVKINQYSQYSFKGELFDSIMVIENYPLDIRRLMETAPFIIDSYSIVETSPYDLTVVIQFTDAPGIDIIFLYQDLSWDEDMIRRLASHFSRIIRGILENPQGKIFEIDILSLEEKQQVLVDFNNTDARYPCQKTLHQLFVQQAGRTPDNTALVGIKLQNTNYKQNYNISITFRELNEKSNRLAGLLKEKGVQPDTVVGIMVERSLAMIIGVLGILKAGGAYLPIDPEYPEDRIKYILTDGKVKYLVKNSGCLIETKDFQELFVLDFEHLNFGIVANFEFRISDLNASNLAYVIYTSGSTGGPKGVMVDHSAIVNTLSALDRMYPFTSTDVYLLKTSYLFDVSLTELFGWFCGNGEGGGRLALLEPGGEKDPDKILEAIEKMCVTYINFVPSMFNAFVDHLSQQYRDKLSGLKYIFAAGEALLPELVKRFADLGTGVGLENLYGPTESAIYASGYSLSDWDGGSDIPIGKPIHNVKLYILDRYDNLQPVYVPGELLIAGAGLARGYLNNPELTAEKFCLRRPGALFEKTAPGPRKNFLSEGTRGLAPLFYHTGDLARWLPDGNIEFLGRMDHQVKIRGFRIELAEIQDQLLNHQQIKEAVVTAKPDDKGDHYLCAYIIPHSPGSLVISQLKAYLQEKLPGYMVPVYILQLAEIPLTPTCKVDRKVLPAPEILSSDNYITPRDALEETLVGIWSQVLGIGKEKIGINSNFFQLGGHSLKAARLNALIHKELGSKLELAKLLSLPTIRQLSAYIQSSSATDVYIPIEPIEEKDYYELSPSQKRFFVFHRLTPGDISYNMPEVMLVEGRLIKEKFKTTFQRLINRQESLRTSFHLAAGEPVQRIHRVTDFEVEYYDLQTVNSESKSREKEKITKHFVLPFDLNQAPLVRLGFIKVEREKYFLMFDMHHIVSDGISVGIFINEFLELYFEKEMTPLRIRYRDYVEWKKKRKKIAVRSKSLMVDEIQIREEEDVLNLPLDYPRPVLPNHEGKMVKFRLPTQQEDTLKALSLQQEATVFMVLLAAFDIFLAKVCNQDHIVVGSPIAGRLHYDLECIIGLFINPLALQTFPSGQKRYVEFLKEVKENAVDAFENQEYQYDELVEKIILTRDSGRNPLYDVMFVLQNMEVPVIRIPGLQVTRDTCKTLSSKFDMTLYCEENDGLFFWLEYSTALFKPGTIERFSRYFKKVISQILKNPHKKIAEIEIIPGEEKQRILSEFNDTLVLYPKDKTIYQILEEQETKTPHHIALMDMTPGIKRTVKTTGNVITYRELNEKANRLACLLRSHGVGLGTVVGFMMERSSEMVVSIQAILKAGGTYLPVDPQYPQQRIVSMLVSSGASFVLTDRPSFSPSHQLEFLLLDELAGELENQSRENLGPVSGPVDLIYIIFTSGSTGIPKGAAVYHHGFMNLMHWFVTEFELGMEDSNLLLTSISFDLTQKNMYASLMKGGTIYIPALNYFEPAALLQQIHRDRVTWINCTPSMFYKLVEYEESSKENQLTSLRYVFLGGEPISLTTLIDWLESDYHEAVIVNTYGPTECTDTCASFRITEPRRFLKETIPVGKPVYNVQLFVTDKNLRPVPLGVPGELLIGGEGVGFGYVNDRELTSLKFIRHSFGTAGEEKLLYRSGDLVKWLPDGNIEFLNRIDYQVKIRGFRAEPGEIENQLLTHHHIKEAVVMPIDSGEGDKCLCAYIVPHSMKNFQETDIREHLETRLPDYMVPTYFVLLDQMPLNPNGKVDRKSLPKPDITTRSDYVPPGSEIEKTLARMWSELLGIDKSRIGIHDNFFRLGGHSLKAAGLIGRIHKAFSVEMPIGELFKTPTIKNISRYIQIGSVDQRRYSLVNPVENKEYYPLSSAQQRLLVIYQLDPADVSYNIPDFMTVEGKLERECFEKAFKKLISRQQSLRTSFIIIDGEPVQKIHEQVEFEIEYYCAERKAQSAEHKEERHAPGAVRCASTIKSFIRPFDLSRVPLLRVGLIELLHTPAALRGHPSQEGKERKYLLMFDMHHITSDAVSMSIFIREFILFYQGGEPPPLRLQYKDFSQWQNSLNTVKSAKIRKQQLYWQRQFEGEIPVLNLPTDYIRPSLHQPGGDNICFDTNEEETRQLRQLALKTGTTSFMLLFGIFSVLLYKLSSQEDIVVGSPIAGRHFQELENIIGIFINTLALRNYPSGSKRFSQFLAEVKEICLKAFENQDYQYEDLVEMVVTNRELSRNSLFDVIMAFQNVERQALELPGLKLIPFEHRYHTAKFDITLTVVEEADRFDFSMNYSTTLFKRCTIKRFVNYFKRIYRTLLEDTDKKIAGIEILSEDERRQLLYGFNKTRRVYPRGKVIHRLFEEQTDQTPDHIAIKGNCEKCKKERVHITYRELKGESLQLGRLLRLKGVQPDNIVAIMVKRSVEMVIGLLGILEAGGAYLPIDAQYPLKRIDWLLADSATNILVTFSRLDKEGKKLRNLEVKRCHETIFIDTFDFSSLSSSHLLNFSTSPTSLAYIIYTSGSTGIPKGVMATHRGVVRLVKNTNYVEFKEGQGIMPTGALEFDASTFEIWGALLNGLSLYLEPKESILTAEGLKESIKKYNISTLWMTSPLFNQVVLVDPGVFAGLKNLLVGGDVLSPVHINRVRAQSPGVKIINGYGPTENTTFSTTFRIDKDYKINIPIGTPIANSTTYIVDKYYHLQPVSVPGELWVGGDGVTRGYMNDPELTTEKFCLRRPGALFEKTAPGPRKNFLLKGTGKNLRQSGNHAIMQPCNHESMPSLYHPITPIPQSPIYRTGDLARWLEDGNIEFLGRIDQQVKIRGYRIELEDIQSQLLKHKQIKEAVVLAKTGENGDKYLCAYLVGAPAPGNLELREYLSRLLPAYMIPSYFVPLEKIPLTPNSKVDRRALPKPALVFGEAYVPPGNEIEVKLVEIWSEVLGTEKHLISIDTNFFEMGGHSLKATLITAAIHKRLKKKIPLIEIFKAPTIKELSRCIAGIKSHEFSSIKPVENKDYYTLSSAQQRLYILRQIVANNIGYNLPVVILLEGELDCKRFARIFNQLISRHESFRTSFEMVEGEPMQRIYDKVEFNIEYDRSLVNGQGRGEDSSPIQIEKIIREFVRPFDLSHPPLLRVGLIELPHTRTALRSHPQQSTYISQERKEHQSILMVDMHHIISDGTSLGVLTREFMALYADAGGALPLLRLQYKDFSEWQNSEKKKKSMVKQETYWLKQFEGDIPKLELPTDFPRSAVQSFAGKTVTFKVGKKETTALKRMAFEQNATLYMVLLAIYSIFLSKITSQENIVIGTPVAGRRHADLANIIGMFVNILGLKNYPIGEKTFGTLLDNVKERTLEAFENQDYQFEELVEKVGVPRDTGRNPLFDVIFALQNMDINEIEIPGLKLNPYPYEDNISKFDLCLQAVEVEEVLLFYVSYSTELFKQETTERFTRYFKTIISDVCIDNKKKIFEIEILSSEEKRQLLFDFNFTASVFHGEMTIYELFEEQVEKYPHHIAVTGPLLGVGTRFIASSPGKQNVYLTYNQLNKKSLQLACLLQLKGVQPDTIVGIMVERSVEMVIGLLGIMGAGGAYLPVDPEFPRERINYMLKDSNAKILLNSNSNKQNNTATCLVLNFEHLNFEFVSDFGFRISDLVSSNLAYIIYTSGTTGQPKGCMISHQNVVSLLKNKTQTFDFNENDIWTMFHRYNFDFSVWEMYGALFYGGKLIIIPKKVTTNLESYLEILKREGVTVLNQTPLAFYQLSGIEVAMPGRQMNLKYIIFGGEALNPVKLKKWKAKYPFTKLVNMFGITETTIHVTYKEIGETEISSNLSNIGRTLPTLSAYVIDRNLNLLPIGVPGELYVAGEGVARGYLNNPQLTYEKFKIINDASRGGFLEKSPLGRRRHLTGRGPYKRIYKSGDLVRWLANGDMEYLGRIDQQVKVRGFRIELGEIESQLIRHKEINDAVVVLKENEQKTQLLNAFFVSPREMASAELREYLSKTMPDYMVPSYFIQVKKIPLTPNGKVDRKALPEPGLNIEEKYDVQLGDIEKKLVEIWSEVLGCKSLGIDDNFFDIGGNSLNIIKVNKRLREAFIKEAAVLDLFRYTTIRSLAQFLQQLETGADALKKGKREKKPGLEIAVIGMAGRFPGAKHIYEFWENLKNGVESSWFFTDRELESSGVDSHLLKDSNYVSANGILEGIEYFDSVFFGCSPREAEIMDPQARIFHECTWSALEDAGYCPGRYEGLIGLYAGAMYNFEWEARVKLSGKADELGGFAAFLLTNKDFLSTWISYKLNLKGPAVVVQTACSTSLAAIHLACQALLNGECDLALAGGVSVTLFEKSGYLYQEGMILSADGHCRAFDAKAFGTTTGNGAAVVVLKPLETALTDNDHIYALVKGSAINNDGIRKLGFTAPSIEGQAEVIIAAQETAGVEPRSITYVETHGTGTPLGDTVEIEALSLAFKTRDSFTAYKKNSCALGSLKTNIGHLDAAAGAAGLIKTVLALYHREIPPSLHFETPNPKINFNNSPFYVNTRLKEWKRDGYPLRAGVSSFGIGGTNAHIILEEAPIAQNAERMAQAPLSQGRGGVSPPGQSRNYQLILLSAKTQTALEQVNRDFLDYVKKNSANPGLTLADAAYTLQVGRGEFKHRQILGCSSLDQIINNQGLFHTRILDDNPHPPTVIFMFTGQGSQYVNMGLDLYLIEPVFRAEMDKCFEILKPLMGYDIKEILYPFYRSNRSYTSYKSYKSYIDQTEITQPVIFAFEYALARLLIRWGIQPRAMIGHSIGEYTAACLSGVFSLEHALELVSLRGKLMQEMPVGSMLSVSLPAHELVSLLEAHGDQSICLAAVNSSSLGTVSGPNEAIEAFARQLIGKGIITRKLHTSHAFHSRMMDPMLEKFAAGFRHIRPNPPGIPFISNLTGTWLRREEAIDPAYWAAQLRKTVLFADGINECLKKENPIFIELGPGNVLSTFTRKHKNKKPGDLVINLIRHPQEDIPGGDLHFFFNQLGRLWLFNVPFNWKEFHCGEKRHRISLPTYPFELKRYPLIKLHVSAQESKISLLRQNRRNKLEDWFYVPQWIRSNILPPGEKSGGMSWLIFMDDFGLGEQLVKSLEKNAKVIILVKKGNKFNKIDRPATPGVVQIRHGYTLVPHEQGHYEKLFQELQTEGGIPGRIVHLWNITGSIAGNGWGVTVESFKEAQEPGFYSLTWLAQAIGKVGLIQNRRFYMDVVTDNMQEVIGGEGNHPEKAVVLGPVQVIPREYPNIFCRSIDIDFPVPGGPGEQQTMTRLVKELAAGPADQACQVMALRGNYRWLRTFVPIRLEKPGRLSLPLKEKGVYLITGGLGGIGLVLAEYLVRKVRARVMLIGRSFFPRPGQWQQWLDTHDETESTSGKIRKLQELNAANGQVMVFSADIANEEQMRTVIREILKKYDRVDGVIHSAGAADGCMIQQRTRESSDPVLTPKLEGTRLLDTLLKERPPDFFVLCSSLSSFLAPFGQAAYCSANAFLDAFAHYKNTRSGTFTISINWGTWQEVGMAAEAVKKLPIGEQNPLKDEILPSEGVEAFERILASRLPQAAVSTRNLPPGISYPLEPLQEPYIFSPPQTGRETKTFPTQQRPELSTKYIEPEDELEQTLVEIIQHFLSIEKVGIDDNFFELGLSSLDLVQIAAKFKKVLEKEVPVVILFKYSTVRALARYMKQDRENKDSPAVKDEPGDLLQSTMDLLDPAAR